jgi:hypothetical protein
MSNLLTLGYMLCQTFLQVEQVANDVLALRGEAAELQAAQLNAKGALETVGAQVG